jgi:hypothetical protein
MELDSKYTKSNGTSVPSHSLVSMWSNMVLQITVVILCHIFIISSSRHGCNARGSALVYAVLHFTACITFAEVFLGSVYQDAASRRSHFLGCEKRVERGYCFVWRNIGVTQPL